MSNQVVGVYAPLGGFVRVEAGVLLIQPNATCVTIETMRHGVGGGVWWITDVVATRLNGALLNVVRTASSDVLVTGVGGAPRYKLGVDYEIINSTLPNIPNNIPNRSHIH